MIKKEKILVGLVCILIVVQFFTISANTNGLLSSNQPNYTRDASVDEDLIDASRCTELAQWDNNIGYTYDIYVQESLLSTIAYLTMGYTGLAFYDVTNPTEPKLVGQFADGDGYDQIIVKKKFAYVTGSDFGIKVIDISSLKNPKVVSVFDDVTYLSRITYSNDHIFALVWGSIVIIDVSNPRDPSLVYTYEFSYDYGTFDMKIKDEFLYVIDQNTVIILDITNPKSPFLVDTWVFDEFIYSFDFYGDTAVVTNSDDVFFYNIENPANISKIVKFSDIRCDYQYIQLRDHYAFIIGRQGFFCFDIENPNNIRKVGEYLQELGLISHGFFDDDFVYLVDYFRGIIIIYLGDLSSTPLLAGKLITNGHTFDTVVHDNVAYVSNYMGGLDILDVSNPTNPKLLTRYSGGLSFYTSVAYENSRVYLGNYLTGSIEILDVSNPKKPIRLSSPFDEHLFLFPYSELEVRNEIAFFVDIYEYYHIYEGHLYIINCSNPANVSIINIITVFEALLFDLEIVDNHLLIATDHGLQIYEMDDDYNLTLVSEYSEIAEIIRAIDVVDNTAYIAARDYGLLLLDISDIENPVLLSSYDTNEVSGMQFGGRYLASEDEIVYMIDMNDGLLVFDCSNPANPIPIGSYIRFEYETTDSDIKNTVLFYNVATSNDVIYISAGPSGLLLVHQDDQPIHWISIQNLLIISLTTTIPFVLGGLIVFVVWRIKKRR